MHDGDHQDQAGEGVIRFRYRLLAPAPGAPCAAFAAIHRWGCDQGWLGRDPARYQGLAYGNLSLRVDAGFWITASQRSDVAKLTPEDLVLVSAVARDCAVTAHGSRAPSSETLTHAAVHQVRGDGPLAVFHGHAPEIWSRPDLPAWSHTPADAANGTFEMARAVASEVARTPTAGALTMRGHEDGILLWDRDFASIRERLTHAAGHAGSN